MKQAFGRTLLAQGHTLDGDAAPIDPLCLYNVDGGKVLPCDPLKRSVKRTVTTKPKGKR